MTQPKTNRIPAPLYAAAGAGELAYQQLRKLPTVATELGNRVVADGTKVVAELGGRAVVTGVELRQKATETFRTANLTATGLRERVAPTELNLDKLRAELDLDKLRAELDLDRLRGAATRNAAVVVAGAQAAQERALAAYGALIARGERVVGAGVLEAADTVNADIEATDATVRTGTTADTTTGPADTVTTSPSDTVTTSPSGGAAADHTPTPADVAEVVEAKPAAAKATRTRVSKAAKATKPAATGSTATGTPAKPKTTKRTRPAAE
ncbi:hypothetical protein ACN265_01595 [Micromonospora sp. WMMD730]|uniref:hypothetical protein n=1 Tax=Micromonospora sp. WMMD730 TaxID=3404128 RepID=UPI003B947282